MLVSGRLTFRPIFFMPIKPRLPESTAGPAWRQSAAAARPVPASPPRWAASRLLDAPHRLGFSAAALVLGVSALWWATMLTLRTANLPIGWAVPAPLAHGLLLTWGFMPLFIVGFLFTAGPRWLQAPEVPAPDLAVPVVLYLVGILALMAGFHTVRWLTALGQLIMTWAWASVSLRFARIWKQGRSEDKAHASVILLACGSGLAGMLACSGGLLTNDEAWIRSGIHVGLWFYIATIFAAVSHRMIPFFTASALPILDAWRPQWLLWALVGALWWVGMGQIVELWIWPLPAAWRWVQASVEAAAAGLFLWLAIRWGLIQSLKIRLLAMLHGGFLWLGLGLALLALHHFWLAIGQAHSPLGLAPLHALTMGYLGTTLFAMATRVAAGHSGRPLAADNTAWTLYWIAQAAVVARLAAALLLGASSPLLLLAIGLWVTACSGWALRYVRWFGLPRLDGRAG